MRASISREKGGVDKFIGRFFHIGIFFIKAASVRASVRPFVTVSVHIHFDVIN